MTKVFVILQEKNYLLTPEIDVVAVYSTFESASHHASIIKGLGDTEVHEVELDPPIEEPQVVVGVAV